MLNPDERVFPTVFFVFAKRYESIENCHNLCGDKSK